MGYRRATTEQNWALVQFDLGDDERGFLLERSGTLFAYEQDGEWHVPAFHSHEAAYAFVRQIDPHVQTIASEGFYDLRTIEAFADRRLPTPPPTSLEVWSLLGEVAAAVDRDVEQLVGGTSLSEPLRMVLANGLCVFRDVVTHLDS